MNSFILLKVMSGFCVDSPEYSSQINKGRTHVYSRVSFRETTNKFYIIISFKAAFVNKKQQGQGQDNAFPHPLNLLTRDGIWVVTTERLTFFHLYILYSGASLSTRIMHSKNITPLHRQSILIDRRTKLLPPLYLEDRLLSHTRRQDN